MRTLLRMRVRELEKILNDLELLTLNAPPKADELRRLIHELQSQVSRSRGFWRSLRPRGFIDLFRAKLQHLTELAHELTLLIGSANDVVNTIASIEESQQDWMSDLLRAEVESRCIRWKAHCSRVGSTASRLPDVIAERTTLQDMVREVDYFKKAIRELHRVDALLRSLHGPTAGVHRITLNQLQQRLCATDIDNTWLADLATASNGIERDFQLGKPHPSVESAVEEIDGLLPVISDWRRVLQIGSNEDSSITRRQRMDPSKPEDVAPLYELLEDVRVAINDVLDFARRQAHQLTRDLQYKSNTLVACGISEAAEVLSAASEVPLDPVTFAEWRKHLEAHNDRLSTLASQEFHRVAEYVDRKRATALHTSQVSVDQAAPQEVHDQAKDLINHLHEIEVPQTFTAVLLVLSDIEKDASKAEELASLAKVARETWKAHWNEASASWRELNEALALYPTENVTTPPPPPDLLPGRDIETQEKQLVTYRAGIENATETLRSRIDTEIQDLREWIAEVEKLMGSVKIESECDSPPSTGAGIVMWAKWGKSHEQRRKAALVLLDGLEAELLPKIKASSSALEGLIGVASPSDRLAIQAILNEASGNYSGESLNRCRQLIGVHDRLESFRSLVVGKERSMLDLDQELKKRLADFFERGHRRLSPDVLCDRVMGLLDDGLIGIDRSSEQRIHQLQEAQRLLLALESHAGRLVAHGVALNSADRR